MIRPTRSDHPQEEPADFGYEGSFTPQPGPLVKLARGGDRDDFALVAPQDFRVSIVKLVGSASPPVQLDVHITDDGREQLRSITVMAAGGDHLTTEAFRRVPVRDMLRVAVAMATQRATRTPDGGLSLSRTTFDDEVEIIEQPKPKPRKRTSVVTDAVLEQVAALYRDHPDAPARAVHELLPIKVSRATADRYIAEARRRGLLAPVQPSRGREGA